MKTVTFDETKWKLVPVEPTEEMLNAVIEAWLKRLADKAKNGTLLSGGNPFTTFTANYRVMLSAAPYYPTTEKGCE